MPTPADPPGRTALIVDDEEMVRTIAAAILRQAGYAILEAGDAESAVAAFRRGGGVELVFLDLTLPGRSGADVLAELRGIDPGVRVLIASGADPDPALLVGPTGYLAKPFAAKALLRAVADLDG
jgi:DNA-binding response OmpR family regulator